MPQEEAQKKLAVDIFELTGMKCGPDDPVVLAALFYSNLMQQSADSCAREIRQASEPLLRFPHEIVEFLSLAKREQQEQMSKLDCK